MENMLKKNLSIQLLCTNWHHRKEVALILEYLSPLITAFNHYSLTDTKSMFMLLLHMQYIFKNVIPNRINKIIEIDI